MATFFNDMKTTFQLLPDTKAAEQSVDKINQSALRLAASFSDVSTIVGNVSNKMGGPLQKGIMSVNKGISNTAASLGRVALAAGAAAAAIGVAVFTTLKLAEAAKEVGSQFDAIQSLGNFGIDEESISRVSRALGDTVDKLSIVQSIRGAATVGLNAEEIEKVAGTAAFLAARLGRSKDEMLKLAAAGQLTEEQLEQIGITARDVELATVRAAVSAGRELSETEKRAVALRTTIAAAEKATNGFTKSTAQASDQGAKLLARYKNLTIEISQKLLPFANAFLTAVNKTLDAANKLLGRTREEVRQLSRDISFAAQEGTTIVAKSTRGIGEAAKQAKIEALQEIRGFQTEARSILRNFQSNFLDLLSNIGGPVSGVISAMREIPERFRVLGSLPQLRLGLQATIGLTQQQIQQLREQNVLSQQQVQAAKLFNLALQAGQLDLKEFIGNERAVNEQLRAGITSLSAQAKLYQVLVEQNNQAKDVAASLNTIEIARNEITSKRAVIFRDIQRVISGDSRKNILDLTGQLAVLDKQLSTLNRASQAYRNISSERTKLLRIQEQIARIELRTELGTRRLDLADKELQIQGQLLESRRKLAELARQRDMSSFIGEQAGLQIAAIGSQIARLTLELTKLQQKSKAGVFNTPEQKEAAREQEASLKRQIDLLGQQSVKISEVSRKQIQQAKRALTLVGTLEKRSKDAIASLNDTIANLLGQTFTAIGTAFSALFEGLVTADKDVGKNFGKNILNALGDLAIQFGSFLIASGTGLAFLPGGQGAIGAAVQGGVLLALGGALKGVGTLVGGGGETAGASNAAATQPRFSEPVTGLGGQRQARERQEVFVLINGASFFGSPEEQFRRFKKWRSRNSRLVGA